MQGVIDCDMGLPFAVENAPFDKPAETPWASVWIVPSPGGVRAVTCGDAGEDEHVGIVQVDLNYPMRRGTRDQRLMCDKLATFFVAGRRMISGLANVLVVSCDKSMGREVDGWWRVSMTVTWRARVARNEGYMAPGVSTPAPAPSTGGQVGYRHEQPTAATTWTIDHSLNRRVAVDVYDLDGNEIWTDVQNTTLNQTVVTFAVATAGYAVIN